MKINKRYKRSVKTDLPFYISASLLTMMTLLMFYLFCIEGTGINKYGDGFFSKYKREDATFSTYSEIPDEKLAALETKYGVTLEKEHFAGTDEGEYKVRVFRPNEKIDLYEVHSGRDLENEGEILISAGYAEENGVKQGDKLKISGKEYTVVGTFLRPDYLYMVENLTDDYKNVTTFFLAYMTTGEFDARFGGGSINYMDQINRLCRCVYGAPLVFLICSDERKTWRSHTEPGYTTGEMDCSIVCTHMMLEAWEQGLGSVWVRLFDVKAVAKAFDLPPYIKPICLLPVGYASGDAVPYAPWDNVYREISEFAEVL